MTINLYYDNWHYYKAQSDYFDYDHDFYLDLCTGKKTLELFAGYGRLSNVLINNGIDLETVELEPKFAKFINLPPAKNHVCDVLKMNLNKKFECIIGGAYNSFVLLIDDKDIYSYFQKMDSLLETGGILSISYNPLNEWNKLQPSTITVNAIDYIYTNNYDLSNLDKDLATWIDEYRHNDQTLSFSYPTRVYKNDEDLLKFVKNTNFTLIEKVINYNRNIPDDLWIEFILKKN